jgi:hypothetical protein
LNAKQIGYGNISACHASNGQSILKPLKPSRESVSTSDAAVRLNVRNRIVNKDDQRRGTFRKLYFETQGRSATASRTATAACHTG